MHKPHWVLEFKRISISYNKEIFLKLRKVINRYYLIFKSGRAISIKRNYALSKKFLISFPQRFGK